MKIAAKIAAAISSAMRVILETSVLSIRIPRIPHIKS
jgi:hypothetical protein